MTNEPARGSPGAEKKQNFKCGNKIGLFGEWK